MKLSSSEYGKSAVGLLKVFREGDRQSVKEIDVSVLVTGDFECAFLEGDNRTTVPTDTIKNTVYILAKDHLTGSIEDFAIFLGEHFLKKYPDFTGVRIEIVEKPWTRLSIDGREHEHSFSRAAGGLKTTQVVTTRSSVAIESGIRDLEILKSTGSGFIGFPKCDYTTLPEMTDRILATKVSAHWAYSEKVGDFDETNRLVVDKFIEMFATQYSRAVQETLFSMGKLALETVPEIKEISLRLPNSHYFLYDLARFGLSNRNEIFYPAPNPHGDISATITR